MSLTDILWRGAGEPLPRAGRWQRSDTAMTCLVCGADTRLWQAASAVIRPSDTDQDQFRAPWSEVVCAGCVWCSTGKPPDTPSRPARYSRKAVFGCTGSPSRHTSDHIGAACRRAGRGSRPDADEQGGPSPGLGCPLLAA